MKYAKFQHRSHDKITKYTALYLEKWSFCWRQQFARVTQKHRVDVSKSHASRKNKLQINKASRMVTQAYWNLARVYVDSRSCEKKCEVLYRAILNPTPIILTPASHAQQRMYWLLILFIIHNGHPGATSYPGHFASMVEGCRKWPEIGQLHDTQNFIWCHMGVIW